MLKLVVSRACVRAEDALSASNTSDEGSEDAMAVELLSRFLDRLHGWYSPEIKRAVCDS